MPARGCVRHRSRSCERAIPLYDASMTERLYYTDAYLRDFDARVVDRANDDRTVYLDRTAFYPTSGGQPFDTGTLAGIPVTDVIDEGDRIAHVLAAPVPATDSVHGAIDWARRFDHMQQHTGQHLLSAIFADRFKLETVSVHFGAESSTLDLDTESLAQKTLLAVEQLANAAITDPHAVTVSFESAATATGPPQAAAARRRAARRHDRRAGPKRVRRHARTLHGGDRIDPPPRHGARAQDDARRVHLRTARDSHRPRRSRAHLRARALPRRRSVRAHCKNEGAGRGTSRSAGCAARGRSRARWLSRARALRQRRSRRARAIAASWSAAMPARWTSCDHSRKPSLRSGTHASSAPSPRHPRSCSQLPSGSDRTRCRRGAQGSARTARRTRRRQCEDRTGHGSISQRTRRRGRRALVTRDSAAGWRRGLTPLHFRRLSILRIHFSMHVPAVRIVFGLAAAALLSPPPPRRSPRCSDSPTARARPSAIGRKSSRRSRSQRTCAQRCSGSPRARITSARRTTRTTRSGSSRSSRATGSTRTSRRSTCSSPRQSSAPWSSWHPRTSSPSCRSPRIRRIRPRIRRPRRCRRTTPTRSTATSPGRSCT